MLLNWLDLLLDYDFDVIYKKGIMHVFPDALSRYLPSPEPEGEDELVGLAVEEGEGHNFGKLLRGFAKNVGGKEEPEEDKNQVHSESHVGALGLYKRLFRDGWYWEGMWTLCESVARNCEECLRYNVGKVGFHPISPMTATLPFDVIAFDFAGPFSETVLGHKLILIIVDVATRYVFLRALKTREAKEVAAVLLESFCMFGFPRVVQHD